MEPKRHCYTCNGNADIDRLPPWERIAVDEFWRVAHAFDSALPGWLVLLPRRHVTTIAELTDAEAASLGIWQVRLSRALHAVTGCAKTYIAQFAEAEGFAHVHFHIVARPADLAYENRGPRVFGLLGANGPPPVSDTAMAELATKVSARLAD
ncbi:MAG TPA: HIT domain-containing protein [Streptosporangiaceae bacterium]|jgi:diadenosine tetraphosphate (Ap4A) HIT family hydrolase|nr:HIT domain-containing protein [Streptosporangiaceae bacterium]